MQEQEDHGVDVQGHLVERRPQVAGLEIPRNIDVDHAVGADAGESQGHQPPRHETDQNQQQQQPARPREPQPLGLRSGEMIRVVGRRRLKRREVPHFFLAGIIPKQTNPPGAAVYLDCREQAIAEDAIRWDV